jgi:hypothetical protein
MADRTQAYDIFRNIEVKLRLVLELHWNKVMSLDVLVAGSPKTERVMLGVDFTSIFCVA